MADLSALHKKMHDVPIWSFEDFDWEQKTDIPLWFSSRHAAAIVAQFRNGEVATARLCASLVPALETGTARSIIRLQAGQEYRHAGLFDRYLKKLNARARNDLPVSRASSAANQWSGAPEARMLAYLLLFEGEFIQMQGAIKRMIPCRLFHAINRVVVREEALHIAFARTYLRTSLPALPVGERIAIYDWLKGLWFDCTRDTINTLPLAVRLSLKTSRKRWLQAEWAERREVLKTLNLVDGREQERFS